MAFFHTWVCENSGYGFDEGFFANELDAKLFVLKEITTNGSKWLDYGYLLDMCYDKKSRKMDQSKLQDLVFPSSDDGDDEREQELAKIISEHMQRCVEDREDPYDAIDTIREEFPYAELLPHIDWETDFEGTFIWYDIRKISPADVVGASSKKAIEFPCFVTHDGRFHADEVFAIATLRKVLGPKEVIRTRDAGTIEELHAKGAYVVDVGGEYDGLRKFDHHQEGMNASYKGRVGPAERVPLSSFGMVWKTFGVRLLNAVSKTFEAGQAHADEFYEAFVKSIDANDNGIALTPSHAERNYQPVQVFTLIAMMNGIAKGDGGFDQALLMAEMILTNVATAFVNNSAELERCREKFKEAWEKSGDAEVLELDFDPLSLDTHAILNEELDSKRTAFIVFPQEERWRIWTRRTGRGFELVRPLLERTEAQDLFGGGVLFIHKKRFVGDFRSREVALAVAQKSCPRE